MGGDKNLYRYVEGNPNNWIDPYGLLTIPFTDIWIPAGEQYGQAALEYWAEKSINPNNTWYENVFYTTMGLFSALWTPCTSDKTFTTLTTAYGAAKWVGRPFWRYVGPNSSERITWVTRSWGWKAPYGSDFIRAADKLHLWEYGGIPTGVIKVPYKMLKPIAGPRLIKAWGKYTGAVEYYYGKVLFP